jgi:hypothetical protein
LVGKRQVEQLAIRAAQDFDAFYEQRAAAREPKDDLLILGLPSINYVEVEQHLRELEVAEALLA